MTWVICSNAFDLVVDTSQMKGKVIIKDGVIVFDNVPIVTPNNDVLVSGMTLIGNGYNIC